MHIIKEYEDVLQDKVKQKKKGSKAKKKPYTLISKHKDTKSSTTDPYEKFISFYPSRSSEQNMFDNRISKS